MNHRSGKRALGALAYAASVMGIYTVWFIVRHGRSLTESDPGDHSAFFTYLAGAVLIVVGVFVYRFLRGDRNTPPASCNETVPQIAGTNCAVCCNNIVTQPEGRVCSTCSRTFHIMCVADHNACPRCNGPFAVDHFYHEAPSLSDGDESTSRETTSQPPERLLSETEVSESLLSEKAHGLTDGELAQPQAQDLLFKTQPIEMDDNGAWKLNAYLSGGEVQHFVTRDDIFNMCAGASPTPLGISSLPNEEQSYIIAWNLMELAGCHVKDIIGIKLLIRFIPTSSYPNVCMMLSLDDGTKNANGTSADLNGEFFFNLRTAWTRVRLYELTRCREISLMVFQANSATPLVYRTSVERHLQAAWTAEISAALSALDRYSDLSDNLKLEGKEEVERAFEVGGIPKGNAGQLCLLERKKYSPPPNAACWGNLAG